MLKNTEFELLRNSPDVGVVTRGASLIFLPGLILALVAFVAGWFSAETALSCGMFFVLLTVVFYWWVRYISRGVVEVSADGLVVRSLSGGRGQIHAWTDIAKVQLNTLRRVGAPERSLAAITRVDADLPFVEIRLKRGARLNPLSGKIGSLKFGVPTPRKSIRIYVRDPEGLVRIAQSYLRAGPSA